MPEEVFYDPPIEITLENPLDQNISSQNSAKRQRPIAEFSTQQQVNPMSLAGSLESVEELLEQSYRFAEELDMKVDKVDDYLEKAKEDRLENNLKALDTSLKMIEQFKKFDLEESHFDKENTIQPSSNVKIEDEV